MRDKYYEFMNDIQTEVNFFAWYDHYFKPKMLAGRNTNFPLQKEATYNSQDTITKHKSTFTSHSHSHSHNGLLHSSTVTSQKTNTNNAFLQKDLQKENIKNSSLPSPNNFSTKPILSLISQNKTNTFQPTTPTLPLLTKNHANNTTHANSASILSLTTGNIHLATNHQNNIATKQTLLVINHANQQDNKDLDKKTNANY